MFRFAESFVKITVCFSGFWWFKLHLGAASHFMLATFLMANKFILIHIFVWKKRTTTPCFPFFVSFWLGVVTCFGKMGYVIVPWRVFLSYLLISPWQQWGGATSLSGSSDHHACIDHPSLSDGSAGDGEILQRCEFVRNQPKNDPKRRCLMRIIVFHYKVIWLDRILHKVGK